jgi:hypothetical protein
MEQCYSSDSKSNPPQTAAAVKVTTLNRSTTVTKDKETRKCCNIFTCCYSQWGRRLRWRRRRQLLCDDPPSVQLSEYKHDTLKYNSAIPCHEHNEFRASFPERRDFCESHPDVNDMRLLRPLNESMTFADFRINTFNFWPIQSNINIQELVSAGFYCVDAVRQIIKCYYCGCAFFNLNENDAILASHAAHYPRCGFVLSIMGSNYAKRLNNRLKNI